MSINNYIIANISLPLKINDDGSYIVMSDNIEIKFNKHDGELISKTGDKKYACDELNELLSSLQLMTKIPIELVDTSNTPVNNAKINTRKNITFKNRMFNGNIVSKYTIKNSH